MAKRESYTRYHLNVTTSKNKVIPIGTFTRLADCNTAVTALQKLVSEGFVEGLKNAFTKVEKIKREPGSVPSREQLVDFVS